MKTIMEFNSPDDDADLRIASRAMDWALTVSDLDNLLRGYLKYDHNFLTADDALERVREELHNMLENRGISLADIL